jgi:hypothetical protein
MIGLLDPALFLPRVGVDGEAQIRRDFDSILVACRRFNVRLLAFNEYWPSLWSSLGRELEQSLSAEGKRALQAVRNLGSNNMPQVPDVPATVWRSGFQQLFSSDILQGSWEQSMAQAFARAVAMNESVVLFVRRVEGRNLRTHRAGNSTLEENTRWVLYVRLEGAATCQVRCVYHPRNLAVDWTTRYDWRLPAQGDHARYPFCPNDKWWKHSTEAFGTVRSKHAWKDRHDNGWARPNIPGGAGYHWDVFIHAVQLRDAIGSDHINVVQYGAPQGEGTCGSLHHVQSAQAGQVHDPGWTC